MKNNKQSLLKKDMNSERTAYPVDELIQRASKIVHDPNRPGGIVDVVQQAFEDGQRKGPIFTCAVYVYQKDN